MFEVKLRHSWCMVIELHVPVMTQYIVHAFSIDQYEEQKFITVTKVNDQEMVQSERNSHSIGVCRGIPIFLIFDPKCFEQKLEKYQTFSNEIFNFYY